MIPEGYRDHFHDGSILFGSMWIELGEYLGDRLGWRWEVPSAESDPTDFEEGLWCYGLPSTCVLALTVSPEGQFVLFIPRGDVHERYYSLDELSGRIEELEHEHEGFTPVEMDLTDEVLAELLEEWKREQGGEGL
jgi:hypothetical protein